MFSVDYSYFADSVYTSMLASSISGGIDLPVAAGAVHHLRRLGDLGDEKRAIVAGRSEVTAPECPPRGMPNATSDYWCTASDFPSTLSAALQDLSPPQTYIFNYRCTNLHTVLCTTPKDASLSSNEQGRKHKKRFETLRFC